MTTLLQTDHAHLARPIELAEQRPRAREPEPAGRRGRRPRRRRAGGGLARRLRRARTPSARRWPPAASADVARRDAVRLARALLPPRPDAAVHRGDPRGRHRARRGRLRRPDREGLRPRPRHPARRGRRGRGRRRRARRRARAASTRPSASTPAPAARTSLFKSAMTLDGKVATHTGDSKWISGEDSRFRAAPLARRARRRRGRDRHGAGRRPAADRAHRRRLRRQPRRVVFDSEARLPLDSQLVRGALELPLTVVVSPRRLAPGHRRARGRRRRGHRRHRRERARARPLRARPARRRTASPRSCSRAARSLAGAFFDAGEVDEIRALHRPGRARRLERPRPARGRGRRAHRRGDARAQPRRRADRRRRADLRPPEGVVAVFTGLVADLGTVEAVEATADGVRLRVRSALAGELAEGDSVAVNGVCLTATQVADGAFTRRRRCTRRCAAPRSPRSPTARRVNLELPLRAADRLGGHVVQGHVDGVGASATRPRTASPASSRSARRRSCCATSSRRARSRSTACR